MRKNDYARTINLASMGLGVDRLSVAFRAADSISESLRALDNPWLKQSLTALDASQATTASALKLSDDIQSASRLLAGSPIMQGFRPPSELMVGWETRFRLPAIAEIGSLLALKVSCGNTFQGRNGIRRLCKFTRAALVRLNQRP